MAISIRQCAIARIERATYNRHALTTSMSGTREENGLTFATTAFNQIEHDLVVLRRVEIMHAVRIGAVMVHDAGVRNTFSDYIGVRLCLEY